MILVGPFQLMIFCDSMIVSVQIDGHIFFGVVCMKMPCVRGLFELEK